MSEVRYGVRSWLTPALLRFARRMGTLCSVGAFCCIGMGLVRAADPATVYPRGLQILAVGNSFTVNAVHYLPQICDAADGVELTHTEGHPSILGVTP